MRDVIRNKLLVLGGSFMRNEQIVEYENSMKERPHLLILGAGASIAAIPNGDKNGKQTSVMWGFIDKLGMRCR